MFVKIPKMAAVTVRKKVVSIGHFSLQIFLFVRSNQEKLYDCTENQRKIGLSQMS